MTASGLTARDLTVRLGPRPLLQHITFAARPGEVTVIVGPNGSGKSTLLRALTGELPYSGSARLNGAEIAACPPALLAAWRAVLPQKVMLSFPFTALEVVRLGLSTAAAPDPRLPVLALERVGLSHLSAAPYQLLSGGEQSRVQLARALVQVWEPVLDGRSRWLFLDEPVASLDIGHQLQVMQIARQHADHGGAVLAVMHDLNLTAMVADRVLLLAEGTILADGPPSGVLTDQLLSDAYCCRIGVSRLPKGQAPVYVLPQAARL